MPENVKLAETGFPWLALLVGIAVLLAVWALGLWLGYRLGGVALVATLAGVAGFASMLGRTRK